MGHDISAYIATGFSEDLTEEFDHAEEISYIRISAFNRHKAHILYDALEARDADGGVSGNGAVKRFTPEQLRIALAKFLYMKGEPEEEIVESVESSEATQAGKSMLESVIKALTGSTEKKDWGISAEDIEHNNEDVLRFLQEIQSEEDIVITFY